MTCTQKHPGGRPPTYDVKEEARILSEWAKTTDETMIQAFSLMRGYPSDYLRKWKAQDEEFHTAYIQAYDRLAYNREKQLSLGKLHNAAWSRHAAHYDKVLKADEREDKVFDSDLKKQEIVTAIDAENKAILQKELDGLRNPIKE